MPKRHPSLIPLSRDHHDGLLVALRLRQGKKALLRQWSHDPHWQATYVVEFYKKHLMRHFEAEEKVLFPAMKKHARESLQTIEVLLNQHEELRRSVKTFEKPDEESLQNDLRDFGELLDEHIRIEEHQLFPAFEKLVPSDVADQVGKEIEKIDKPAVRR